VGIALCSWSLGPKPYTVDSAATVKVDVDGSVVVLTGATDQGGGQWSMLAQVASEVLGVPMDRVHVIAADTEATPNEIGTSGSNVTYRVGNSVRQAAEDARRQLVRVAARRLQADEEELVVAEGAVFRRAAPTERLSIATVARAAAGSAEGTIIGTSAPVRAEEVRLHGREQAETVDSPAFGCHVAQIRVDPETGQIEVERFHAVHDVGHALNPLACVGQVQGGVVFGLGYALSEEILNQDGTNVNANLWEYLLPTAPGVPDISVELVEVPSKFGPFGAKGLGEAPCIGVAAAVANALEDALGVRVTQAPLTPERVLAAVRTAP
jgi:CO/xanthine dehydrogenase Mo-binding subunit